MRRSRPQPLAVTTEERQFFESLITTADTPPILVIRARIILMAAAHPEQSNWQIATIVATTATTVRTWRRRWLKTRTLVDYAQWRTPSLLLVALP